MHGTRERHVTRWEVHSALLDTEIEHLEHVLATEDPDSRRASDLRRQLAAAQARRRSLGPSPRHKMG